VRKRRPETRQERWKRLHPWARYVEFARRRCACTDPEKWWPHYGAKGIQCFLTAQDLEIIWSRDGAERMRKPSLDRIDSTGHYEPSNVRFVEFTWNSRRAWDPSIDSSDAQAEFT
jgi:hypothetical protein